MRDPIEPSTNDHFLRESGLAEFEQDERDLLVSVAVLAAHALREYTKGNEWEPGPLMVGAIARDVEFVIERATETVGDWSSMHSDDFPDEERALEEALPHLRAALEALAPALDEDEKVDAPTYSGAQCRRVAEDFRRSALDFVRHLERFPSWHDNLVAGNVEPFFWADGVPVLRDVLFGDNPEEPLIESLLGTLNELLDADEDERRSTFEARAHDFPEGFPEEGGDGDS